MADQPAGSQGQYGGLLEHVREMCAGGASYLRVRLTLAGIEAKEALLHFGIIIGLLALAISVIVFGYLFLCIALTVLIAQALGVSPGWVILALAVIHFAVAALAAIIAVMRLKTAVFTATLDELKKDQQWLNRT
ncbi:MAG TPA: phage holin family protein [Chthoniobacteraceae bacterium]|jgi:uncharacterized membrane protein YqjE|nr:phage holin family protein [Chthoniobacteraceae bacterium]